MTDEIVTKKLTQLEDRIKKLESVVFGSAASKPTAAAKKQSPKEFLIGKTIKTDTQKVLVLSYYLEQIEGMQSFNVVDLETVFRLAKEKLPSNMNDAVNKNIGRGFIMEAAEKKDSKKAWSLTSTGERFVENDLNSASR